MRTYLHSPQSSSSPLCDCAKPPRGRRPDCATKLSLLWRLGYLTRRAAEGDLGGAQNLADVLGTSASVCAGGRTCSDCGVIGVVADGWT